VNRTGKPDYFAEGTAALGRADLQAAKAAFENFVELNPESADGWCYLGMSLTFKEPHLAAPALDRALSIDPQHHGALYWRAEVHWVQGDPRSAAELLRRLNEIVPDVSQNIARMAFAYLAAGDEERGTVALGAAVDAGGGLAGVNARPVEVRRAIYLDMLGRHDEALRLVQTVNGARLLSEYSRSRYPRDLEEQRCALENVVAGRDVVILGSGPSLGDLQPLLVELGPGGCEELCFFGFNNVPVAERMLEEAIGRGVDLACMTSAAVMELHAQWLSRFFTRGASPHLFLTLAGALTPGRPTADMVAAHAEQLFFFAADGDHPPIPGDPLHFPPINALMCVLPLAVLGQPRRIFLFGCDGAAPDAMDKGDAVYFRQGSAEFGQQQITNAHYARWLQRDTFFFNAMISTVLSSLSILHRVIVPPVYNCNPESAYRPFARIPARDFVSLQTMPHARTDYFPARVSQVIRQIERLSTRHESGVLANGGPVSVLQIAELQKQVDLLGRELDARAQSLHEVQKEADAFRSGMDSQAQRIGELEEQLDVLRRELEAIKRFAKPLRMIRRIFSS
jgi:hypothetical protein